MGRVVAGREGGYGDVVVAGGVRERCTVVAMAPIAPVASASSSTVLAKSPTWEGRRDRGRDQPAEEQIFHTVAASSPTNSVRVSLSSPVRGGRVASMSPRPHRLGQRQTTITQTLGSHPGCRPPAAGCPSGEGSTTERHIHTAGSSATPSTGSAPPWPPRCATAFAAAARLWPSTTSRGSPPRPSGASS